MSMKCRICGRTSGVERECKDCRYFLDNGADESALRRMHSDKRTMRIWKENERIAEALARAYYDFVISEYDKKTVQKNSKEDFGFNTFVDGIRCGIDIIVPMLDDAMRDKVKEKIKHMIRVRTNADRHQVRGLRKSDRAL